MQDNICLFFLCLAVLSLSNGYIFCTFFRSGCRERKDDAPAPFRNFPQSKSSFVFFMASKFDSEQEMQNVTWLARRQVITWGSCLAATIATTYVQDGLGSAEAAVTTSTTFSDTPKLPYYDKSAIPFSSRRKFKTITLANGLRLFLVSDKKANGASAALSVAGAGQFSDPVDLPGLAHLMEHMVLSYNSRSSFRRSSDFEEWLCKRDGFSNGFTAYDLVCFHFAAPEEFFAEALERFSGLFYEQNVVKVCNNEDILKREVRRVSAELDGSDKVSQAKYYLVKNLFDPSHPYSRFAAGNLETLERFPKEAGIDVADRLVDFFRERYQPHNAVLVVVSSNELSSLERWITPFGGVLSRQNGHMSGMSIQQQQEYPEPLKMRSRSRQMILYRQKSANGMDNLEKLSLEWVLSLDCSANVGEAKKQCVTATQVGFVISQILGRRGPGSLYMFLFNRGWVPYSVGVPRISISVNVSRFHLIKMEVTITRKGFANRSAVIAAIYDSINSALKANFLLSRALITQYATMAQLHGYVLALRPPDAVEIAVDAQKGVFELSDGFGSGEWQRFPLPTDRAAIFNLDKTVKDTLSLMSDPLNAFTIVTATDLTLQNSGQGILEDTIPPVSSDYWYREPITGARYCFDDSPQITATVERWFSAIADEDELLSPVLNPFIPPLLRPPRFIGFGKTPEQTASPFSRTVSGWKIVDISTGKQNLPIPLSSPEPSCRCAFVVQLLSSRPARANIKKAAHAELWKVSFEKEVQDLAELGAPAGLAYDISFNKFGMRICFLGISQNLASYTRRFCRRLVDHHNKLLAGFEPTPKTVLETALSEISTAASISSQRRRQLVKVLRESTSYEAAIEGIAFLKSSTGAVCLAQGDLLPKEVTSLCNDLEEIFGEVVGSRLRPVQAIPSSDDIVYPPRWKPRSASSCTVPGVPLLSDACGRILR